MSTENYNALMAEIDQIAEKVKLFPEHVQEAVFNAFHSALVDNRDSQLAINEVKTPEPNTESSQPSETPGSVDGWNVEAELIKLADEYGLRNLAGQEFAAVAVYFYTDRAPKPHRLDSVSVEKFEEACLTIGHPVGSPTNALNNAKRKRNKYLQGGKREGFTLTGYGRNYVKNTILKPKA